MKKSEVLKNLDSNCMNVYHLSKIAELYNSIKSNKTTLETMERHKDTFEYKSYIVHHGSVWDNYEHDLDTLSVMSDEFRRKQKELWDSGKYSSVNFTIINNIEQCPECDRDSFSWDENNGNAFVIEWDIYDDFHKYGVLWALIVTDKIAGDIKETLAYKDIEARIAVLEQQLNDVIKSCNLFEKD